MNFSLEVLTGGNGIPNTDEMALVVLEGLSKKPKGLPSRYFYDDRGSEIFRKIMALPEYYPTDCEREILTKYSSDMVAKIKGDPINLVELGCGDGTKTLLFLQELVNQDQEFKFFPLDISSAAIEAMMNNLTSQLSDSNFETKGLVAEYFQGLSWLTENSGQRNLILFLGSNIGNFDLSSSLRFLRQLWFSLNSGDFVIIGFDLKKSPNILHTAYNDSQGVTAEFNLNLLDRINEELGANFNRGQFTHQGLYNVQSGAMESYLISLVSQEVYIQALNKSFSFRPWEAIHMEYSYKFLLSNIQELAASCGYEIIHNYTDDKNYFIDSLWKVIKK